MQLELKKKNTFVMSSLAVILTGFDDVCCRSNSLCNFLIINKALNTNFSFIDVYVHPSEFKLIYKYYINTNKVNKSQIIKIVKGWSNSKKYDMIYTVYSSVISSFSMNQKYEIIDSSLSPSYITKNLNN